MQGYTITSDFLPLELNNVDIILDIQWLETLEEMRVNWKLQTMKISIKGKMVVLQGVSDICSSEVSFQALGKLLNQPELSVIVDCRTMVAELTEEKAVPAAFEKLFARFQQVFEEPHGLPHSKGREHAITLSQESNPVSVQPFVTHTHRRNR